MDRHYSEIGGKPINLDKEESEMSDTESMRRVLRFAIRESISRTAAIIVSRPFTGIYLLRYLRSLVYDLNENVCKNFSSYDQADCTNCGR